MRSVPRLSLMLVAAAGLAGLPGCAAPPDAHGGHGATGAPVARGHGPAPTDARMAAMMRMHERMKSAATPAQREALMADHMKAMRDGMAMMKEMPTSGAMGGMEDRHRMMEKRLDAMAALLELMMDRLPPAAPN